MAVDEKKRPPYNEGVSEAAIELPRASGVTRRPGSPPSSRSAAMAVDEKKRLPYNEGVRGTAIELPKASGVTRRLHCWWGKTFFPFPPLTKTPAEKEKNRKKIWFPALRIGFCTHGHVTGLLARAVINITKTQSAK